MQVDLIDRLAADGMTQEVIDAVVISIEEDGDRWVVLTNKTIKKIYVIRNEEVNDHELIYTVEEDNDGVALSNIE